MHTQTRPMWESTGWAVSILDMYLEVLMYLTFPFGLLVHNILVGRFAVNKKIF